jgi:hypothetical protein
MSAVWSRAATPEAFPNRQRLNPLTELDVAGALAVQVGGTIRRIGKVRRVEK